MTAKPHDALFKAAFEHATHAAELFRCVLPESLRTRIDYDAFKPELGSFIDPTLADSHSDLLFSARLQDEPILLYLLLEHQSTNDFIMPLRMMEYIARIGRRHHKTHPADRLPLTVPLVVSHAPGGWTAPVSFHELVAPDPASIAGVAELVPNFRILVEDLAHLSNEQLESRAISAFPKLALWLLRDARDIKELLRNATIWAETFGEALRAPSGSEAAAQVFHYVARITKQRTFRRFRDNIRKQIPEAEEAIMELSAAEEWELEGSIKTLLQLLTIKFGKIPSQWRRRLKAATPAQVERYTAQILSARTIEEVFAEST